MVPWRRLELPRPNGHKYLKLTRLPIPPPGHQATNRFPDSLTYLYLLFRKNQVLNMIQVKFCI